MRKIYILLLTILLFAFPIGANAEDISLYLNGQAVNIIETKTNIDIYVRIAYEGEDIAKRIIPLTQISYGEAVTCGVKLMCDGEYDNKVIKVHFEKVNVNFDAEKVTVIFS